MILSTCRCSSSAIHLYDSCNNHGQLRKTAQRLCDRIGVAVCQNNKPGKHLPFSHPSLQKVREWLKLEVASNRVHPRLLGNFDQVWSVTYQPRRSTLQSQHRRLSLPSGGVDPCAKSMHQRRLRHFIERSMGMNLTEQFGENGETDESPIPFAQIAGGFAGHTPVDAWRVPHTLTTFSWCDGTLSRGFITCCSDYMGESQRKLLNEDGFEEIDCWHSKLFVFASKLFGILTSYTHESFLDVCVCMWHFKKQ